MRSHWRAPLVLSLATSLVGLSAACRVQAPNNPGDDVDAQIRELESWLGDHADDDLSRLRLAQLYWLYRGAAEPARGHLERLAKSDHPLAHFELAWMAYARLDADAVRFHAARLLELAAHDGDSAKHELARHLASPAARLFDDVYGSLEGDDAKFVTWMDGLNLARLPAGAADVLTKRRAKLARIEGQDEAPFYALQGCLQDWAAGPVEGHLGAVDLGRFDPLTALPAVDVKVDPAPVRLSCAVRLWNTSPHPGVRRARSQVQVQQGPLHLQVHASESVVLFVDGQAVYRSDDVRQWAAQRPELLVDVKPGLHTLEVQTTVDGERAWFSVRAREGSQGTPLRNQATTSPATAPASALAVSLAGPNWLASADKAPELLGTLAGEAFAPLRLMLALDDALAHADSDRAEQAAAALRDHERGPAAAKLLLADFENMDPSRARTSSSAREQAALESAIEIDPQLWRAQLRLAQLILARQDASEALARLSALEDSGDAMQGWEGQLLRFAAYRAKNNELLADEALARALTHAPRNCDVLSAARQVAQERQQVALVDGFTTRMLHCPGGAGLSASLAMRRGEHDKAAALYAERLARTGDDLSARGALAEVAVAQQKWAEAQSHLEAVLEWAPWRATTRVALADVLVRQGQHEAARAQLDRALERTPHLHRIWELASQLGVADPIRDWRVKGLDYFKGYEADNALYEGAAQVLVLDRDVAWVYPDGSQRHLIHQITHLRSKAALDAHGELQIPDGAQLLTLRTIKPDGRIVEPENVAGKEGVSLRELELGDMFEMEYVLGAPADPRLPGYVDLSRFRFASFDTPYHHSELVVVHPPDMPVQVEARNFPPKVEKGTWKGKATLRFLAQQMGRHNPEPGMRSSLDELPMVRVFTAMQIEDWLAGLEAQIRTAQRTNPQLRAKAAQLVRGKTKDREKLEALWAWVLDNVEEAAPIAYPATVTFSDRKGSALMLLRVMLREAGVRNELWLARDKFGPADLEGGHPLVSAYETPMLAVYLDGATAPIMVMTSAKTIPLGYLTPGYSGATAYALQLDQNETARGKRTLPETDASLADARSYELKLSLDATGAGVVEGSLELRGLEALFWRNELERIDVERRGEAFQAAELPRLFGHTALDLESLEIEGIEELDAPLRFRFRAAGLGVAVQQGQELLLPLSPLTMNLAGNVATLPERSTGMVISFAPKASFDLEVELVGLAPQGQAGNVDEASEHGTFVRTVKASPGHLHVQGSASLRAGVVEPEDYPGLLDFASRVATQEQAVLKLTPKR